MSGGEWLVIFLDFLQSVLPTALLEASEQVKPMEEKETANTLL